MAKMGQCLGGGLLSLSLSLSLSRCSHFLARLWVKFKGLFYSFCRSFILSYRKFFLFYRSFNSSFYLQKAFFRAFCLFEFFKCFIFGLFALVIASRLSKNGGFCHFERSDPTGCKAQAAAKKSTKIKRKLAIFGYFACAQYDKVYQYYAKSVWYGKTNQYDEFRLSPKFFKTNEKFKEFKEFANFLKKFIRGVKTTLCVAGLCYNEIV